MESLPSRPAVDHLTQPSQVDPLLPMTTEKISYLHAQKAKKTTSLQTKICETAAKTHVKRLLPSNLLLLSYELLLVLQGFQEVFPDNISLCILIM